MESIGMGVHQSESQISILIEQGEILERRIRTQREWSSVLLGCRRWAIRITARRRRHVTTVALARRLAGILFAM
jgi:hypothetical protein